MTSLLELLNILNTLTPIGVAGLFGIIIFTLVRGRLPFTTSTGTSKEILKDIDNRLLTMETNHLHELPEMANTLRRIEVLMSKEFSYIRARLNGKG